MNETSPSLDVWKIFGGAPILRGWRRARACTAGRGRRGARNASECEGNQCCGMLGAVGISDNLALFVDIYNVSHPYGPVRKVCPFELNPTVTAPVSSILRNRNRNVDLAMLECVIGAPPMCGCFLFPINPSFSTVLQSSFRPLKQKKPHIPCVNRNSVAQHGVSGSGLGRNQFV